MNDESILLQNPHKRFWKPKDHLTEWQTHFDCRSTSWPSSGRLHIASTEKVNHECRQNDYVNRWLWSYHPWEKICLGASGDFVQSSSHLSWREVDFSKSVSLALSMRQGVDKTKKTTLKFTLDCSSVRWVERPFGGSFPWLKKEIVHHFWAWSETNVWKRYLKGNAKLWLRVIVVMI